VPLKPFLNDSVSVPFGEGQHVLVEEVAHTIQNLVPDEEGGLTAVRGPADFGQGAIGLGRPHGIHHASLNGGTTHLLLARFGGGLYRFRGGGSSAWDTLQENGTNISGLSDEGRVRFPDQFVTFNNTVIWTNGIDRARIITHEGDVLPLGFSQRPSPPQVDGPEMPGEGSKHEYHANSFGYSWPGDIGTAGDALTERGGKLLQGEWLYYLQYFDDLGNLGPLSAQSNAFRINEMISMPAQSIMDVSASAAVADETVHTAEIDDLQRQALVRISGNMPFNADGVRVLRTMDTYRTTGVPRLAYTIYGTGTDVILPDGKSDSVLGAASKKYITVPVFRVMCVHQGCLVIGNIIGDPGLVRKSVSGFAGTFIDEEYVIVSAGGSELTALVSYSGTLYAFTERAIYDITDFSQQPRTVVQGVGAAGPRAVQVRADGVMTWQGPDGTFYSMVPGEAPRRASDTLLLQLTEDLNLSMLRNVRCGLDGRLALWAVPQQGSPVNDLLLAQNLGGGWSRFDYGISVWDICQLDGWPGYSLIIGQVSGDTRVWVLNREHREYDPPARECVLRTTWLRVHPSMLKRFSPRFVYVASFDRWNDNITFNAFKDFEDTVVDTQNLSAVGPGFGETTGVYEGNPPVAAGSATIGTDVIRRKRLYWRKIPVGEIKDCRAFSFELRSTYPASFHVVAFAFDFQPLTDGDDLSGRIPGPTE
jgi:hypothetical protein